MKVFLTLWYIDSARKSDDIVIVDPNEVVDRDFSEARAVLLGRAVAAKEGNVHSGLIMRAVTASNTAGLSLPETDSPCLPFSISKSPVHHLFSITVRLSRSSGLNEDIEGCSAYDLRNGKSAERTMPVFMMPGLA